MKKKNLLKKIKELEATVNELQMRISFLESRPVYQPPISLPSVWTTEPLCSKGGSCQYPLVWHGTTPPPCMKCGMYSGQPYTITTYSVQGETHKVVDARNISSQNFDNIDCSISTNPNKTPFTLTGYAKLPR